MKYPCIIPTVEKDFIRIRKHLPLLFEKLPISEIIFIGPSNIKPKADEYLENLDLNESVSYIDENDVISTTKVLEAYRKRYSELFGSNEKANASSFGWYYQQFLKLGFSNICKSEYYLTWDSDTLPMRNIEMFNSDGVPFFDIKPELQESYFKTINNLFGFGKTIEKSFVTEHMIFKCDFVKEMINQIEQKNDGKPFYEAIFSAIENFKLGFAEFETYGTWVSMYHTYEYRLRNWKSLRNTSFMVDMNNLTEDDIKWLSEDYDAASFEKYQETEQLLNDLFCNPENREKFSPEQFYRGLLEMGCFGEYKNGVLITPQGNYPV